MPANLTPEYMTAEREFREARTPQERLGALRRMLATIPKHKGTEKLQADIKRRISRLNEEIQKAGKKKGFAITVPREGAGQVVLVGPPNAGKSALVAALTHGAPDVADYPFTTHSPYPAMMPFENIQIQLVDLPAVSSQHTESWVPGIIRTADAVLLIIDLVADDPLEQVDSTLQLLEQYKLRLVNYEPEFDPWASVMDKRSWMVCNKLDCANAMDNFRALQDLYEKDFPMIAVSAVRGDNLEQLRRNVYDMLNILRVCSKPPGKEAERDKPFVLKRGSTLVDFAGTVHHDFGEKLRFARIWGDGKFDGQRVNKDYELQDGDIIELHL